MTDHSVTVLISGSDFLIRKGIKALVHSMPNHKAEELNYDSLYESVTSRLKKFQLLIHEFEQASPELFEEIERINKVTELPVLLVMGVLEKESIQRLINLGVRGIITKQCSKEEIVNAISTTVNGGLFLCNKVSAVLFNQNNTINNGTKQENKVLTARETEVLTLITKGHTTMAIADILHLSVHTINSHRKNILKKFNLKSPVELIVFALENNLVDKA